MVERLTNISIDLEEGSVPETLFIPVYSRAKESSLTNSRIKDTKALEVIQKVPLDFKRFDGGSLTHQRVLARTWIIDEGVKRFLKNNPKAIVINLGCGLDTRFSRVDNSEIQWYDLDLSEVIKLRQNFFRETDRIKHISSSILDYAWMDEIKTCENSRVLFIAEGLFLYFTETQLKDIFYKLTDRFPDSQMYMTAVNSLLVGKGVTAKFTWGIDEAKDIEKLNPNIKLLENWSCGELFQDRLNIFLRSINRILPKFRNSNLVLHIALSR